MYIYLEQKIRCADYYIKKASLSLFKIYTSWGVICMYFKSILLFSVAFYFVNNYSFFLST